MKTSLTYGFAFALAGALLNLALYLLGYHSNAAKYSSAEMIVNISMLVIGVTCIVLGTKARRNEVPLTENFGYGSALATGVLIALFAGLLGVLTNYIYMQYINPGFTDVLVQAKIGEAEARGANPTQIEQMEKMMRLMMRPAVMSAFVLIGSALWGTIISLITAAFLKRRASEPPMPA